MEGKQKPKKKEKNREKRGKPSKLSNNKILLSARQGRFMRP